MSTSGRYSYDAIMIQRDWKDENLNQGKGYLDLLNTFNFSKQGRIISERYSDNVDFNFLV
jgi:hypothetical protein